MSENGYKEIQNILDLKRDERKDFLDSIDLICSDCDGVYWHTSPVNPIPGAAAAINYLQSYGMKVAYVTNNNCRPQTEHTFRKMGVNANEEDIIHPAKVIVEYLKSINFTGLIYCLATQIFKNYLRKEGYQIYDSPREYIPETLEDFFKNITEKKAVKAVIIDTDMNLSSIKLSKAELFLKSDPNCLFFSGASDLVVPIRGYEIMGNGAFIELLEKKTSRQSQQFGKPGKALADYIMEKYKITDPQRILMIGDSMETDIVFANRHGFRSLLVMSGTTTVDSLDKSTSKPDFVIENMKDLIYFY